MKHLLKYNESRSFNQVKEELTELDLERVIDAFELQIVDDYKMIEDKEFDFRKHGNYGIGPATKTHSKYAIFYNNYNRCIEIAISKSPILKDIDFNKSMKLFKERIGRFGYVATGHASSYKFTGGKKYFVVIFKPTFPTTRQKAILNSYAS